MIEVLRSILNDSRRKLGFQKGVGNTYDAILTVKSIPIAQKYFELLTRIKNGEEPRLKISEKVKQTLPDFPKFAITYSVTENEEESSENQDKMKEALKAYNDEFKTHFSLSDIKAYNADINDRLARKKERYSFRHEQLDLVIVVNRLLTGFDAPCLSTLFIDRAPMNPQDLIQAFSRTNRLFDRFKNYGQIVTFQKPDKFKDAVDEALRLYSNGGGSYVLAPTWKEEKAKFDDKVTKVLEYVTSDPNNAIDIESSSTEMLRKFAKAYQEFDKTFSSIQVYSEYKEDEVLSEYGLQASTIEELSGTYENVIEELKRRDGLGDPVDGDEEPLDVMYELESVHTDEINYEYILSLIQTLIPDDEKNIKELPEKDKIAVDNYIAELNKSNSGLAQIINDLWLDIQIDPTKYVGQSVSNILDSMIKETIATAVKEVADKWFVGHDELAFVVKNYRKGKERQLGEQELNNSRDYEAYKEYYGEKALPRLKYLRSIKPAYTKVIEEVIEPLQNRR